MAISKYGIFGPQNGKIGPVVLYMLNGQQVCRAVGRYIDDPSANQKVNRNGMSVIMNLLQPLHSFIKCGFELKARGTVCNAFNLAVSHNKKYALTGEGVDLQVDYSKVLLSNGSLPSTSTAGITKVDGGVLINWKDATPEGNKAHYNDMVMIALYYPGEDSATIYLNEAKRKDEQVFIRTSESFIDKPVEAYMTFKSADGTRISDSVYVGNLNGAADTKLQKEEKLKYRELYIRFEQVKATYEKEKDLPENKGKKTAQLRHLEKQYKLLLKKLGKLPGKPG